MTMCASRIGSVPTEGFEWYVVLLEGQFGDEIRSQIDKYFLQLGKGVGADVLVVRGYDPIEFKNSFIESASFYGEGDWKNVDVPALVVTDAVPKAIESRDGLDGAKVMIFPLRQIYERHKDISIFFDKLIKALHSSDAADALDNLEISKLEKSWGWFSEYAEMKPGFFGFKADLSKMIGDMIRRCAGDR